MMGLIYALAVCTISATASEDSTGGCFFKKDPFAGDCHLREQDDTLLYVTLSDLRAETAVADTFKQKVESAPLNKRGWTFQERVLSSRLLHFCEGVVLFECNTMQASSCCASSELYPTRKHIRADGKLQAPLGPDPPPRAPFPSWRLPDFVLPNSPMKFSSGTSQKVWVSGMSTRPITRPVQGSYVNVRRHASCDVDCMPMGFGNPIQESVDSYRDYKNCMSWSPQIPNVVDMSARLGMRGAFEMLLRFKGESVEEKIAFHENWYDMVHRYSMRNLTEATDKIIAIEGVAYFIQQSTNFTFASGLWLEVLHFNLLWTRSGPLKPRPVLPTIPTWSWASVDSCVSHRLQVPPGRNSQPMWEEVTLLISDVPLGTVLLEPNPPVLCEALQLRCYTYSLDSTKINFTQDAEPELDADELVYLPILLFKNVRIHPCGQARQLHGIVIMEVHSYDRQRDISTAEDQIVLPATLNKVRRYKRVGYFWTVDKVTIGKILHRKQKQKDLIQLV